MWDSANWQKHNCFCNNFKWLALNNINFKMIHFSVAKYVMLHVGIVSNNHAHADKYLRIHKHVLMHARLSFPPLFLTHSHTLLPLNIHTFLDCQRGFYTVLTMKNMKVKFQVGIREKTFLWIESCWSQR